MWPILWSYDHTKLITDIKTEQIHHNTTTAMFPIASGTRKMKQTPPQYFSRFAHPSCVNVMNNKNNTYSTHSRITTYKYVCNGYTQYTINYAHDHAQLWKPSD